MRKKKSANNDETVSGLQENGKQTNTEDYHIML